MNATAQIPAPTCWRCGSRHVADLVVSGMVTISMHGRVKGAVNNAPRTVQTFCCECGQVQSIRPQATRLRVEG